MTADPLRDLIVSDEEAARMREARDAQKWARELKEAQDAMEGAQRHAEHWAERLEVRVAELGSLRSAALALLEAVEDHPYFDERVRDACAVLRGELDG